jgi:hypothetical protein
MRLNLGHERRFLCPFCSFYGKKDAMSKVAINTPAPNFEPTDHTGKLIRLSDFQGHSNVLLVFNRGFF